MVQKCFFKDMFRRGGVVSFVFFPVGRDVHLRLIGVFVGLQVQVCIYFLVGRKVRNSGSSTIWSRDRTKKERKTTQHLKRLKDGTCYVLRGCSFCVVRTCCLLGGISVSARIWFGTCTAKESDILVRAVSTQMVLVSPMLGFVKVSTRVVSDLDRF